MAPGMRQKVRVSWIGTENLPIQRQQRPADPAGLGLPAAARRRSALAPQPGTRHHSHMKSAVKAALFLLILFAIPVIPFLWLGESFEQSLLDALHQPQSPLTVSVWVAGLLASDMFLPVPSSAVVTYAGGVLGVFWGTIVSWLGLSLGAVGGFALARGFGEPLVRRFSESADVTRMSDFAGRHGATALVLTRALPILAEACIFMLGAGRLSWRKFLVSMLFSNALLALTYSACGAYFRDSNAFPIAIVASGAVPLVAALVIRRYLLP
ncbi:MAG: VTT domain-containing protein [Planctomycetes bacterium]|nr:VTT domain-containing protein [Planctomycetota bacterium]